MIRRHIDDARLMLSAMLMPLSTLMPLPLMLSYAIYAAADAAAFAAASRFLRDTLLIAADIMPCMLIEFIYWPAITLIIYCRC